MAITANTNHPTIFRCFSFLSVLLSGAIASCNEGEPVAVRAWPNGCISIESMWDLEIAFGPSPQAISSNKELTDADLRIARWSTGFSFSKPGMPELKAVDFDYVLDRKANQSKVAFQPTKEATNATSNRIKIRNLGPKIVLVDVDGVSIAIFLVTKTNELEGIEFENAAVDALVFPFDPALKHTLRRHKKVRHIISVLDDRHSASNKIQGKVDYGNTKAISSKLLPLQDETLVLSTQEVELKDELAELFEKKEIACADSRAVFAKLSVAQLNFQPSNGTHTPRWNCEHMMGRELGFFSEIFGALDSSIPKMNLNPAQMPPDYRMRHPDWTGAEEARQMARVEAFTRRFAHLLNHLDLDAKAPRSFWTPRRLLLQMQRHYGEHTSNVKKKFELEDWPKE